MKKSIRIVLIIFLLNVIFITNVFATFTSSQKITSDEIYKMSQKGDISSISDTLLYEYIVQLMKTPGNEGAVEILLTERQKRIDERTSVVLDKTEKEFQNLSDEQLKKYMNNLKIYKEEAETGIVYGKTEYVGTNAETIKKAISRIEDEIERREEVVVLNKCNSIIKLTDTELQGLSEKELEQKLKEMEYLLDGNVMEDSSVILQAISKLTAEQQRRANVESMGDYKDYKPNSTNGSTKLQTIAGKVLGIVRNIGVVVSIIVLSIIGIKYMFGSVEQKAEYKKSLIPFVIGVIMLVAGTTLVTFIYEAVSQDEDSSSTGPGYWKEDMFESYLK